MKMIVMLLLAFIIALNFSGCGCNDKVVYLQCRTPKVPKEKYDNIPLADKVANAKRIAINHAKQQRYIQRLEQANLVCQ